MFIPQIVRCQYQSLTPKNKISVSYFGETFTHPGISATYSTVIKDYYKVKVKRSGVQKIRHHEINFDNRIAAYNHRRNHTGLLVTSGFSFSKISKKGLFWNLGIYGGGLYRFLNEDTYSVNANGQVSRIRFAGRLNYLYGLRTSIGRQFSHKRSGNPYAWFISNNIFFSGPFGTSELTQSALELGITYTIKK